MSSFFTLPASQKKRKRKDADPASRTKKQATNTGTGIGGQSKPPKWPRRDESISSGSEDDEIARKPGAENVETSGSGSESDRDDETGAERRLRLAERYLENIKSEVQQTGFDAEEIDRDLIAERLKEDVAESKGRLYRHITSSYDFSQSIKTQFRADTQSTTSIAVYPPYIYTVSKDITLIKWELPTPTSSTASSKPSSSKKPPHARRRPTKLLSTKGYPHHKGDSSYQHHTAPILTIVCSPSGEYLATGSSDHKLMIWSTTTLTPLRIFTQHRDAITSLAFRLHTNQLYSASKDRTIKTWSLNEMAYVETLFGHQDEVLDVCAGGQERCISVGGRDRTARLWKVVEETQLVFRGGGGGGGSKRERPPTGTLKVETKFSEGSIDRVAFISDDTFITGSDNGSLSLWNIHKKKPISTIPLAHGLDPPPKPEDSFAESDMGRWVDKVPVGPQPRWITALKTIPFSDLVISGSWDGWIRVWRVSADEKKLEAVGKVGRRELSPVVHETDGGGEDAEKGDEVEGQCIKGIINDLAVFEKGERGQDGLCIVAAVGKEHRLGRWKKVQGKNGAVLFEIPRVARAIES